MLREWGWNKFWAVTQELLRDPYSHTVSAMRGDKYVPDPAEVAGFKLIISIRSMMRGKNQVQQPIKPDWEGPAPTYGQQATETLTDDERAESRRQLEALAGID